MAKDDKEKLHVYDENGLYLATKKIGKNNPKAEQIQMDNEYCMHWNREVDRAIVSGVPETEIQQIKKEYISDRIKESIDLFGRQPERFGTILMSVVAVLAMLISKVLQKARELSAKFFEKEAVQTISGPSGGRTTPIIPQTDSVLQQEHKFKVMSAEAAAYPKLSNFTKN